MGILFSCCMNDNDSHTQHPDASIPKNDGYFKSVLHMRNEYEDINSPSTSEALEDTNLDGNQPNIVLSAPQSSELDVAVSRGMCDIPVVAEPQGTEDLVDTSEALEDRNLVGNQPNIVISAPQPLELDVAVSRGMCDNQQVAEPQLTALVVEENRGYEDLLDTQIEGIMQPCCEETPKIWPYLCDDEEQSLPDICNQLYQVILSPDEEDVCPTCLEDYDPNNPKILTECSHHFHLSCIYAWMERSNTCPICFRVMVFDEAA